MLSLLLLLASPSPSHLFSITDITASVGEDPTQPAYSGTDAPAIELQCRMTFNPGERWTRCSWTHQLTDVWGYNNQQGYIMCTAGGRGDHNQQCSDVGNLADTQYSGESINPWVQAYASRISFMLTDTACGIRINQPHANDTGVWKCMVDDNSATGQSTIFWADMQLYVANRSEVVITDPDVLSDKGATISLDLTSGSGRLQATCLARYGVPAPTIVWYIDDPVNKISSRDGSIDSRPSTGQNTVQSTVSLSLDLNRLSSLGVRPTRSTFAFTLGCYPDQGTYFTQSRPNMRNPAEVVVFARSGASILLPLSLLSIALQILLSRIL